MLLRVGMPKTSVWSSIAMSLFPSLVEGKSVSQLSVPQLFLTLHIIIYLYLYEMHVQTNYN